MSTAMLLSTLATAGANAYEPNPLTVEGLSVESLAGHALEQQATNLQVVATLSAAVGFQKDSVILAGVRAASERQLGRAVGDDPTLARAGGLALASVLLGSVALQHDISLGDGELALLGLLDELPQPLGASLRSFLTEFDSFDFMASKVLAPPAAGDLDEWLGDRPSVELLDYTSFARTGISRPSYDLDSEQLLSARLRLLGATLGLEEALRQALPRDNRLPIIRVPPLIAVDLVGTNDEYREDYIVTIEVGGDDAYYNNAGGSHVLAPSNYCPFLNGALPNGQPAAGAAILVDIAGNDRYLGTGCGVNGGATIGAGFLFDSEGDDVYAPQWGGAQGHASNGGADDLGVGFLLDLGGEDRYEGGSFGSNGGAHGGYLSLGLLFDAAGNDSYTAGDEGANGGAFTSGAVGFLLDLEGDDDYAAGSWGTNGGGGGVGAAGFLLDVSGNDVYSATDHATNGGGGTEGATGFLADLDGADSYSAGRDVTNGGGGSRGAAGFLLDMSGGDTYRAGNDGTNGGAGILGAAGFLVDISGNDLYSAGDTATNGGSLFLSAGHLLDLSGDDIYLSGGSGTNGGVAIVGTGMLFDAGGKDRYADSILSCVDCSSVPKGVAGAQVDAASGPASPSPWAVFPKNLIGVKERGAPHSVLAEAWDACADALAQREVQ